MAGQVGARGRFGRNVLNNSAATPARPHRRTRRIPEARRRWRPSAAPWPAATVVPCLAADAYYGATALCRRDRAVRARCRRAPTPASSHAPRRCAGHGRTTGRSRSCVPGSDRTTRRDCQFLAALAVHQPELKLPLTIRKGRRRKPAPSSLRLGFPSLYGAVGTSRGPIPLFRRAGAGATFADALRAFKGRS